MAQLVALGCQIVGVLRMDGRHDRHLVDHFQIKTAVNKGVGLLRVVRQQSYLGETFKSWIPTP